jgi:UDPglucose 6-dehydrogenase
MKIAVIGTGYVGLVTGTCFAEMGNTVTCLDIDQKKIEDLKNGVIPIHEPGLEEMIKRCVREERLFFATDYSKITHENDLLFIAVGTPPGEDGSADLKYVLQAAECIAQEMNADKIIVNKSTVPVGTGALVRKAIQRVLDARGVQFSFDIVSNPEFLKEGTAIDDFMKPDRIVVGIEHKIEQGNATGAEPGVQNDRAMSSMRRLYEPFIRNGRPILFMDIASCEMTKYAANALLATKISFINEISRLCERLGADVEKVRRGIGADQRIGYQFIYPGLGYGGSCFPKDVKALVQAGQAVQEPMRILEAVEKVNQLQRTRFIEKIRERFRSELKDKTFAIWGLAFKPGTDDIREAPSMDIIEALLKAGAKIRAYDPVATSQAQHYFQGAVSRSDRSDSRILFSHDQYEALNQADALCIMTEWKSFREPDYMRMKATMLQPWIFDGRNLYEPEFMRSLGFHYTCIGRPIQDVVAL